jgi:hypothetical protein
MMCSFAIAVLALFLVAEVVGDYLRRGFLDHLEIGRRTPRARKPADKFPVVGRHAFRQPLSFGRRDIDRCAWSMSTAILTGGLVPERFSLARGIMLHYQGRLSRTVISPIENLGHTTFNLPTGW